MKDWTLFAIGLVVIFLPFLGFPESFDRFVFVVAGIVLLGIALRRIKRA